MKIDFIVQWLTERKIMMLPLVADNLKFEVLCAYI